MEITCSQMDILLSFYIDGELTDTLRERVEKHLNICPTCRAKYNILTSIFKDLNDELESEEYPMQSHEAKQYRAFKSNLSAYVDNELPQDENIKIKKYTINNKKARKDLEETYRIRKLMKDSFRKTKNETKPDFTKSIMKKMNPDTKSDFIFNPLIKVGFAFVMTVLILSIMVVFSLSM
ncbi:zf-HC2 domain-containing protein [bacterium]|nr:zf-HC2 domain-containing protein [bacterium]